MCMNGGVSTTSPGAVLFTNGSVFDGHRYIGIGAVLVRKGRIVEVRRGGGSVEADGAEVVDLGGGLIAPGFVDAHTHAVQGGLERLRCDLSEGSTRDDYLRTVNDYADTHPDADWILGGGWAMAGFPGGTPMAADLDRVVPDRPVFLPNRDHHGAWVNSRALDLAGITAATPDPAHGRFERDGDGVPTGMLHEGAMHAVADLIPPPTGEEYYRALLEAQRYLHSLGITGWQDAIVGAYAGMSDPGPTYVRAARNGDLTADVVGALWWDRDKGQEQVESLVARRRDYTCGRFRANAVKIMQDGIAENFTAALTEPYLDRCGHATTNTGHSFLDPTSLKRYVASLDAAGFQVHIHAIGDRGAREALDALAGTDPSHRHHIAHLQLIRPEDISRFAQHRVAANLQMLWACLDEQMVEFTLPFLGPERASWQYPFGALHRAGTSLVAGSDWPVSSPDPLAAIHVGVTRTVHGDDGPAGTEPFLPEQALPLESAFAAYTSGSAWVCHRDDAGVLRPGAVADVVVLDTDPFAGRPADIGAATVVSTWIDGVAVYRR
jgi:predicted amidohydrolase YtcJ